MKEALKKLMGRFNPHNVLEWAYDAQETIEELLDKDARDREPSPVERAAKEELND